MKYLGMAIGAVVVYYAYKVAQSEAAMLVAAGVVVGVGCVTVGIVLAVLLVRAMQPRRASNAPQAIDASYTVVPQLGAQKTAPQFRDAGSVQMLGVPQEVSDDAWR